MDYLFHQIVIFILTAVYMPLLMAQGVLIASTKCRINHICHIIVILALGISLPNTIKHYQQYIMGHFSGLPETITRAQVSADIIVMIVLALIAILCIYVFMSIRKATRIIRLLQLQIKQKKRDIKLRS